ncbi:MAG: hypothetical protein E7B14_17295 [Clostridium sp.]|nr:hypothetical protein [Clostridium sp.]
MLLSVAILFQLSYNLSTGGDAPSTYERNYEMDIEKIRYDLSLTYAKSKLDQALADNRIPVIAGPPHPDFLDEIEFLANEFSTAFMEYSNYDIEYFIENENEEDI